MDKTLREMVGIIDADPAIDTVNAFSGGGGGTTTNTARMFIALKPLAERKINADQIIAALRPKLARVPGATLYLQAVQDLRVGGRSSNAQYQYTMRADNLSDLTTYAPRMLDRAEGHPCHHRRQQRSTGSRLAGHGGIRPQDCRAIQHLAATDRRRAVRCIRPAAGVHHVFVAESISRGDGGRAAILAESEHAARSVCCVAQRRRSAFKRDREERPPPPRRSR